MTTSPPVEPRPEAWAQQSTAQIIDAAQPWRDMSDAQLWSLVFAPTVPRSHHVWSDGFCPSCKKPVPMYEWKVDALKTPWKMSCPACGTKFPTNDFEAYHRSGLDDRGWFDPARADKKLLFNADHPDPADPLHQFGVDDGNGAVVGEHRWRFIGAYMIYGHWRQLIVAGVAKLTAAFQLSGCPDDARKALTLLDRVADTFPGFDYATQGWMYEKPGREMNSDGHVSYWCDNCEEIRTFAESYRVLKPATESPELLAFLGDQGRRIGVPAPKAAGKDIRQNIETGIFRHALDHPIRYRSNFPRAVICRVAMLEAFGDPSSLAEAETLTADFIHNTVLVDGVTGEKGLPTYSAYVIHSLGEFLARREAARPGFIKRMVELTPNLKKTWRFFLDTRCLDRYYPQVGDGTWFGSPIDHLCGVSLPSAASTAPAGLQPSGYRLLWSLYEATGDADYVREIYRANGNTLDKLPHDLVANDGPEFRAKVDAVIQREGATIRLPSIDKKEWHLAILRSGEGDHARALWIDYDTGGNHGHMDGMNVGLFAHGLDLIPDFGYPPVQFGGWASPKSRWYYQTAAHHSVVIDGKSQPERTSWGRINAGDSQKKGTQATLPQLPAGATTLWRDQTPCRAIRVDGRPIYDRPDVTRYERTLLLVDVGPERFYVVDIFCVAGGSDHAMFFHSHFSRLETAGLSLSPAPEFGHGTLMRDFKTDPAPREGWCATFHIDDRYKLLPAGRRVTVRRHDLTAGATGSTCEGWINAGHYAEQAEVWVPRVMIRRSGEPGLSSVFVGVIEAFTDSPTVTSVRRAARADGAVELELSLAGGLVDRVVISDVEKADESPIAWSRR